MRYLRVLSAISFIWFGNLVQAETAASMFTWLESNSKIVEHSSTVNSSKELGLETSFALISYIEGYRSTADSSYLVKAKRIIENMLAHRDSETNTVSFDPYYYSYKPLSSKHPLNAKLNLWSFEIQRDKRYADLMHNGYICYAILEYVYTILIQNNQPSDMDALAYYSAVEDVLADLEFLWDPSKNNYMVIAKPSAAYSITGDYPAALGRVFLLMTEIAKARSLPLTYLDRLNIMVDYYASFLDDPRSWDAETQSYKNLKQAGFTGKIDINHLANPVDFICRAYEISSRDEQNIYTKPLFTTKHLGGLINLGTSVLIKESKWKLTGCSAQITTYAVWDKIDGTDYPIAANGKGSYGSERDYWGLNLGRWLRLANYSPELWAICFDMLKAFKNGYLCDHGVAGGYAIPYALLSSYDRN